MNKSRIEAKVENIFNPRKIIHLWQSHRFDRIHADCRDKAIIFLSGVRLSKTFGEYIEKTHKRANPAGALDCTTCD